MKTSEMKDLILDWAVATANGDTFTLAHQDWAWYSSDWSVAGPIIEREMIEIGAHEPKDIEWVARDYWKENTMTGPTPLIAAMRCYVASKLGDDVEIPKELLKPEKQ